MEQTYDLQRSYVNVVVEHVVLGLAATVAVAFRFHARRLTKAKLGWDDWLSVVAAVFMWIDTALTSLGLSPLVNSQWFGLTVSRVPTLASTSSSDNAARYSQDQSTSDCTYTTLSVIRVPDTLQLNWVSIFFVSGCQVFARLSVIMLYYRLFSVRRRLTYWLKGLGAISICWLIQMYIGTILACRPVKAIFDATVKGKCVDVQLAYVITNSVDTALDSAVLLLSIPVIMKLTLPTREKLGIASIFLAGGIVVATGLVRIVMAAKPEDQGELTIQLRGRVNTLTML